MRIRLPVTALLVQPGEPPMHLSAVVALVAGERIDERPIEVEAVPGTPHYVIRNGRHRFLAALIAGHTDVPCILEPSTQETP